MKLKEPRACNASTKRRLNPYNLRLRQEYNVLAHMLHMFKTLEILFFDLSALKALVTTNKGLREIVKSIIEDRYTFLLKNETSMKVYNPQQLSISKSNENTKRALRNACEYTALKHLSCFLKERRLALVPVLSSLTSLHLFMDASSRKKSLTPLPENILHLRVQGMISSFAILPKSLETLSICFHAGEYDTRDYPVIHTAQLPPSLKHLRICAEEDRPVQIATILPENLETLELFNCTYTQGLDLLKKLRAVRFVDCFTTEVPLLSDSVETMIIQSAAKIRMRTLPLSLKHLLVDKNVRIEKSLSTAQNLKFLKAYRKSFSDLPPNLEELDLQGENTHADLQLPSSLKTLYMAIILYYDDLPIIRVDADVAVVCYGVRGVVPRRFQVMGSTEFKYRFHNIHNAFYFQDGKINYGYPLFRYNSCCGSSGNCSEEYKLGYQKLLTVSILRNESIP